MHPFLIYTGGLGITASWLVYFGRWWLQIVVFMTDKTTSNAPTLRGAPCIDIQKVVIILLIQTVMAVCIVTTSSLGLQIAE